MARIQHIHAREVFDSRGRPTVEVEVTCDDGGTGRAIVPSGASTGQFEAHERRDGGTRLGGAGVRQAVAAVNTEIAGKFAGWNTSLQFELDRALCDLDGTPNKSRLGANALLGVSLAVAHAASSSARQPLVRHLKSLWDDLCATAYEPLAKPAGRPKRVLPEGLGSKLVLPLPMVNLISGGLHAGRNLDMQDFLMVPVGAGSYSQALDWIVTVYHTLGRTLIEHQQEGTLVGDEGGYGPKLARHEAALELILEAVEAAGLRPGEDVALALDVASTHFFEAGRYTLKERPEPLSSEEMSALLTDWCGRYPIVSLEDGMSDDDWPGWKLHTQALGNRVQLIGDDLFVTNQTRLGHGVEQGVANSVLVKLNQVGTLTETLETVRRAFECGYTPVISARSGETEDTTMADLAVAVGAGQIKIGSVARSERLAKYNQLLRLEEQLGADAAWLGGAIFKFGETSS